MESVYYKFKNGYAGSPDQAIDFYKAHTIFFTNKVQFETEQELLMFVELCFYFLSAFVVKKQYKNALSAIKAMPAIEEAIDKFKINRADFNFYKALLFQQGIALAYLRDYKSGLNLFRQFRSYEPENDSCRLWIDYCKLGSLKKWLWIIIGIFLLSTTSLQFLRLMPHNLLHLILVGFAFILAITSISLLVYIEIKSNRKLT